jgi:hypothetical protein
MVSQPLKSHNFLGFFEIFWAKIWDLIKTATVCNSASELSVAQFSRKSNPFLQSNTATFMRMNVDKYMSTCSVWHL